MPAEGMKEIGERNRPPRDAARLWLQPDRDAALARSRAAHSRASSATSHAPKIDAGLSCRSCRTLEIVSSFGVGYDHVDAAWAGQHGIMVTHTPGVLDAETADTAMALTLMAVRRLPQAERYLRAGRWAKEGSFPLTASLRGRTMGILGLGRIGKEIAKRAVGLRRRGRLSRPQPQDDAPYLYYPSLLGMAKAVRHSDGLRARRSRHTPDRQRARCWRRSARTACWSISRAASLVDRGGADRSAAGGQDPRARASTCSRTSRNVPEALTRRSTTSC